MIRESASGTRRHALGAIPALSLLAAEVVCQRERLEAGWVLRLRPHEQLFAARSLEVEGLDRVRARRHVALAAPANDGFVPAHLSRGLYRPLEKVVDVVLFAVER